MEEIRAKIQSSSLAVCVGLFIVAGLLAVATALSLFDWWAGGAFSTPEAVHRGMGLVRQLLLIALLGYAGRVFCRISLEETPFFATLPRKIKLGAALLFFALAVPQWVSYPLAGTVGGNPSLVLIDQTVLLAFLLAAVVFCLGQIFEYGYLVQDENFEIL